MYKQGQASLVAQVIKNLPAVQETWVRSLGQEDPLEERAWQLTPVFLPGEFHRERSLAGCSPWGCKESDTTEQHCTCKVICLACLGVETSSTESPQQKGRLVIHTHTHTHTHTLSLSLSFSLSSEQKSPESPQASTSQEVGFDITTCIVEGCQAKK